MRSSRREEMERLRSIALLGAVGALPGGPEAWNLALGIIPITLGIALVSQSVKPASRVVAR